MSRGSVMGHCVLAEMHMATLYRLGILGPDEDRRIQKASISPAQAHGDVIGQAGARDPLFRACRGGRLMIVRGGCGERLHMPHGPA